MKCDGSNTVPSPWLRAVVRHHPGVTFRVTDRGPLELYPAGSGYWAWHYQHEAGLDCGRHLVPEALLPYLGGLEGGDHGRIRKYPATNAACAALGRSLWLWSWLHET